MLYVYFTFFCIKIRYSKNISKTIINMQRHADSLRSLPYFQKKTKASCLGMEKTMEFGTFLAKLRKEKGCLQKEVAAYLNVTVATVSNYKK